MIPRTRYGRLVDTDEGGALRRRARAFRRARIAMLVLVVGWFFLPYGVRWWIPVWLPFLAALALEAQFFVGGHLQARRGAPARTAPDRGPQPRDLADLGVPEEEPEQGDGEPRPAPPVLPAAPRRPQRRSVLEAAAALALVAGILVYATRPHGWSAVSAGDRARTEAALSREASLVAGHPARVACDTSGRYVGFVHDSDGLAFVGGARAYLTPGICDTLYQLAFKRRVQSFPRTARALAVLGHEAWHLRGVADEGRASCYGFQSGVRIGVHLGLSESEARSLMREQLATNAADSAGAPAYLVPSGCHDGGSDDLAPGRPGFP